MCTAIRFYFAYITDKGFARNIKKERVGSEIPSDKLRAVNPDLYSRGTSTVNLDNLIDR